MDISVVIGLRPDESLAQRVRKSPRRCSQRRSIAARWNDSATSGACIKRMFTTEKARAKMGRTYPLPIGASPKES